MMEKFKVIVDGGSFIDGVDFDDFEQAKNYAIECLIEWQCESAGCREAWDTMITECYAWVKIFNADVGDYVDYWYPDDEDICWKYADEMTEEEQRDCGLFEN